MELRTYPPYGISGLPILQLSRKAGELLHHGQKAWLQVVVIDTMSREDLSALLAERFQSMPRKSVQFSLVGMINKRLIPVLLKEAGIEDLIGPAGKLTAADREKIVRILTSWKFAITGTRSWPSAQVTAGGVDTGQIDPYTLASKLVPGLFFAGEMIDVDGACGGFNLQWAWSSGYVAGRSAAL